MSPIRHPGHIRPIPHGFVCRYVERTLGQLGEDALDLPLVSRHLTKCPSCRAHRRRVSKVDRALHTSLHDETPPWFEGRWEEIASRAGIPLSGGTDEISDDQGGRSRSSLLMLVSFVLLLAAGWWTDIHPDAAVRPVEVAPGITVTGASVKGEEASVTAEPEPADDGTVFLWITPETDAPSIQGIGPE